MREWLNWFRWVIVLAAVVAGIWVSNESRIEDPVVKADICLDNEGRLTLETHYCYEGVAGFRWEHLYDVQSEVERRIDLARLASLAY
jgi:hypothetical protein